MDFININGHHIVFTKLAVLSKGFNLIKTYDKPIAQRVTNIERKNGLNYIKVILKAHKDNNPVVIPNDYLEDIKSFKHYGDFEYAKFTSKFPIYEVELIDYDSPVYVLVDEVNIFTYFDRKDIFKTLENNLLKNIDLLGELWWI